MDIAHEEMRVRERAYALWEEEGRPAGREFDHWVRARSEIAGMIATAIVENAPQIAKKAAPRKAPAKPRTRKTLQ
jgi:hypothetical protein